MTAAQRARRLAQARTERDSLREVSRLFFANVERLGPSWTTSGAAERPTLLPGWLQFAAALDAADRAFLYACQEP